MIHVTMSGSGGRESNYKEIMIDSPDDVSDLPTSQTSPPAAPGSTAYTKDLEHTYLLGLDDVWREV